MQLKTEQATRLTPCQQETLEVLHAIRAEMRAKMPELHAKALGGLSHDETLRRLGVVPDGQHVGNCYAQTWRRVRGLTYRTYLALERAGRVFRYGDVFVAF